MNLRQIRAFHAVMITRSVSKAAIPLHLTQPAVSKLINNLEDNVGYKLFERIGGKMIPTPEATYLFQEVDTMLSRIDRLDSLIKSAQSLSRDRIKIGCQSGAATFLIPSLLDKFKEKYNSRISLIIDDAPTISDRVANQTIDIGVIDIDGISPCYNVEHTPVTYYLAMKKSDPLTRYSFITPEQLSDKQLISITPHEKARKAFEEKGVDFQITHEVDVHMPAASLVRAGLGYALIDAINVWTYENHLGQDDLIFKAFKPNIKESVAIITPILRPLPDSVHYLSSMIRESILSIEEQILESKDI